MLFILHVLHVLQTFKTDSLLFILLHFLEESFSTLLRKEAFMWSENIALILFFLPMKHCCSNSQSELSQFTFLSPITFTQVCMSLAPENLALQCTRRQSPMTSSSRMFHSHILHPCIPPKNKVQQGIFQNRYHMCNIYTYIHIPLFL